MASGSTPYKSSVKTAPEQVPWALVAFGDGHHQDHT